MESADRQQLLALLGDPATPAATLAQIAGQYPESWPLVARHPNVYPGLLEWMRQQGFVAGGGPAVTPASPAVPLSPSVPRRSRRSRRIWVSVAASIAVITLGVAGVLLAPGLLSSAVLSGASAAPSPAVRSTAVTTTPAATLTPAAAHETPVAGGPRTGGTSTGTPAIGVPVQDGRIHGTYAGLAQQNSTNSTRSRVWHVTLEFSGATGKATYRENSSSAPIYCSGNLHLNDDLGWREEITVGRCVDDGLWTFTGTGPLHGLYVHSTTSGTHTVAGDFHLKS
ncbi:MAG: hypothetical protein IPL36_13720 [Nigerium sp.]|nr:hypothetical protein [Nigerium sp.]